MRSSGPDRSECPLLKCSRVFGSGSIEWLSFITDGCLTARRIVVSTGPGWMKNSLGETETRLRLAFVCAGDPFDLRTWSGTPSYMLEALEEHFDINLVVRDPFPAWFVFVRRVVRRLTAGRHRHWAWSAVPDSLIGRPWTPSRRPTVISCSRSRSRRFARTSFHSAPPCSSPTPRKRCFRTTIPSKKDLLPGSSVRRGSWRRGPSTGQRFVCFPRRGLRPPQLVPTTRTATGQPPPRR